MLEVEVQGNVDPRFSAVREAFISCFTDGLEHGAAVAAVLDGKVIVDLWAGHADAAGSRPWQRDTLVNVWSATKGVMALAVAMLVERGNLRYDAPISKIWPEFAEGGKEAIPLDFALSHRAGLDGLSAPMDLLGLYNWQPYVTSLGSMAPLWEPGSRCVYHTLTYGHLAGEVLRRADGRPVSQFVAEEIAGRLGATFFIGLPDAQDHRVAEIIKGPKAMDWVDEVLASPYPHSCLNPPIRATLPNERAWRAAEIPGANGQADALGLATIYGSLVATSDTAIASETRLEATRCRFQGVDAGSQQPTSFAAGFRLSSPDFGARSSVGSFGHGGWGGTLAFADPQARLGFAFVTCKMLGFDDGIDPRRQRLVGALYDAL